MLTMYIAKEQNRWDEYLSQIMMAYRSSKQSSTGQIPNMLKLGRKVTLPLQVVIESPKEILEAPDVNVVGSCNHTGKKSVPTLYIIVSLLVFCFSL
jgi:hypothetical protein